jgi:hypothetical protein
MIPVGMVGDRESASSEALSVGSVLVDCRMVV